MVVATVVLKEVVVADASGIYTLTPSKTNDTLYVSTINGNTTEDVKFPQPFVKTGFIGG